MDHRPHVVVAEDEAPQRRERETFDRAIDLRVTRLGGAGHMIAPPKN
jgi:hypothetical protein